MLNSGGLSRVSCLSSFRADEYSAQFWAVFFIVAIVLAEIAEAKKKSCNVCKCVCKYKKNKKGYGALYKKTVYKKKPSYPYAHSSSSSSSGYRRSDDDEG
ncbi:unnamed protein product [Cyprideis torosa]|uniref:Uncharacterized protein n=1 Tax=Cyprideis torosa TaxID=163714 RepID=A0A7R8ZJ35_9CRUS|nr:unnamed protein product [Cyprideis torosa]CAG0879007.1 unnamed protein product [Cyprideis torosa]